MPTEPRKRTHQQKAPPTQAEIINKLVVWLQEEIPYALRPMQESAFKREASRLLSESEPADARTKTARRKSHPPKWVIEMVDILNRVEKVFLDTLTVDIVDRIAKAPLDTFVIDDRDMVAYRKLMRWWNFLRGFGVPKPHIDLPTLATRLYYCAFVSLARSQSANADEFIRAAITVIAVDHWPEIVRSEGWRFRIRHCQAPRCSQWFLDRSPTWYTTPKQFCSPRCRVAAHRATLADVTA